MEIFLSEDQDFEIIDTLCPPAPFDRALAHLEMRTTTNDFSQGMDLSVSATFGEEYVEIPLSDGDVLEVKCGIKQAIIVATHFNCAPVQIEIPEPSRGFSSETQLVSSTKTNLEKGLSVGISGKVDATGAGVPIAAAADANAKAGHQDGSTSETTWKAKAQQVDYSSDQIRINERPDGAALSGKIIDGQVCWRVTPYNSAKPFGVLAEMHIKRGWMPISEPRQRSMTGKLHDALAKVFSAGDKEEEFHRKAFSLLVEHLIQKGLQSEGSGLNAILAANAVVAKPIEKDGSFDTLYMPVSSRRFELPVDDLKTILAGDPASVLSTLSRHDIDDDSLEKLLDSARDGHNISISLNIKQIDAKEVSKAADWLISAILREFGVKRQKEILTSVKELSEQTRFLESPKHTAYNDFLQLIIQSLARVKAHRDFSSFGEVMAGTLSVANALNVLSSLELNDPKELVVDNAPLSDLSVPNPKETSLAILLFLLSFKRAFPNVQKISIRRVGNRISANFTGSSNMYFSSSAKELLERGFSLHRDAKMVVPNSSGASLGDILGAALKNDDEMEVSTTKDYSVPLMFLRA
jgi:hypothetical protein